MMKGTEHPLTCGQRWLLFLLQQSPTLARPVQRIYRLRPRVDTSALLAAFRYLVGAHPALRIQLREADKEWKQAFPKLNPEIAGLAIQDGTKKQRAAYARYVIAEESAHTFDLRTQPPFKVKLVKVDKEHFLSLCVDHIATDDLALDLLERQWEEAYVREVNEAPHPDRSGGRAFLDYLVRESSLRKNERINLEYWRAHLAGAPLGSHEGEEIAWVPGENRHWQIAGEDFKALVSACRISQCSLFTAVVAAQVMLLGELSNTDDLVLNIPVSNRSRAEDHNIVANLSMLLHLRFRTERNELPAVFVRRVRDEILRAMAHRQYDYAALSQTVAADAASRGGRAHWLIGCSYIIKRGHLPGHDMLFLERLDNQPGQTTECPHTAFTLAYHQSDSVLHCIADWDPSTWQLHGPALEERYTGILGSLMGISLSAKKV
jgi:fengycin family lipopeptide synthetase D